MAGTLVQQGATVLCSHGGQAQPTAPNPRVTPGRAPAVSPAAPWTVAGCPLPPNAGGPCVTAMWTAGTVRVRSSWASRSSSPTGTATCVPTGVPLAGRRDPGPGDGVVTSARLPPGLAARARRAGPDRARRRRALPARPGRAGAVHPARRAGEPAGLRQRRRRARVRPGRRRAGRRPPGRWCTARCSASSATCSGWRR